MKTFRLILLLLILATPMWGQVDRKEVRRGNREFKKGEYEAAFQDYLRAVEKDTASIAANYNMASALYRMEQYDQAQQALDRIKESAPVSASAADYLYNLGDVALQRKDYQAAVDAFAKALILRPEDLDAKENYIYARKKLEDQQNQQQNDQNNDQNQDNNDQNQNDQNQDNQDQNNDQNDQDKQDDQNKDDQQDNKDQNQDQQQNDKPQDQQSQPQQQEAQITPQAAQQMLQAIQAKEKETQDKVNKKKAEVLKSRQKDKNW